MPGQNPRGTLGERIAQQRSRAMVGRHSELSLLREVLEAELPPYAAVFVHGPGGVGKSTLLRAAAEQARALGRHVVHLDAREIEPTVAAVRAAVGATAYPADGGRVVLLVDTFELLADVEDWFRTELLAGLPADSVAVVAGRRPPSTAWVTDPGWADLLRTVSLRNLRPEEAESYLEQEDIPAATRAHLGRLTQGHPLSLALVRDLARQGRLPGEDFTLDDAPGLVRALLETLLETVPTERHRTALRVAAHAQATTEDLLRGVVDEASTELFAWLAGLSFMAESPKGLVPHDLVRDLLEADFRWRDPDGYRALHEQLHRVLGRRVLQATGKERHRRIAEVNYLQRTDQHAGRFYEWSSLGEVFADDSRPEDLDELRAMVRTLQGEEQAALFEHWLGTPALTLLSCRTTQGELVGLIGHLHLERATPEQVAADPGAAALMAYIDRVAPLRPGDRARMGRFFMDRDNYQGPSKSNNAVVSWHVTDVLENRAGTFDFVGAYEDGDAYEALFAQTGYYRVREAEYQVGTRHFAVFGHDFRRTPPMEWFRHHRVGLMHEAPAPRPPETEHTVLSQPDFATAVRRGLRELHREPALAANPLAHSRLSAAHGGGATGLRAALEAGARSLADSPREENLARVLDRTFLRPAPTQEAAAEVLGLPWSTYRRHLGRAEARLVELLWEQELYG